MFSGEVKLSVIIPTFNSGITLSNALDSVLEQSFIDFEVLIIDGMSHDNTLEIANSYNDERIRVFSQKDDGIYDAMNKGIGYSKGEWVYFLGSDDRLYTKNVLFEVITEIGKGGCDIIYGDVYSTRFNGRYGGEFDYLKILNKNICHQSIFFKKTIFLKTGHFEIKYKSHADWNHNMAWLLDSGIKKKHINCVIAEYADGGYSSLNGDPLFASEKIANYLIHSKNSMPFNYRFTLLKEQLRKSRKKNTGLFFKLLLCAPRILLNG